MNPYSSRLWIKKMKSHPAWDFIFGVVKYLICSQRIQEFLLIKKLSSGVIIFGNSQIYFIFTLPPSHQSLPTSQSQIIYSFYLSEIFIPSFKSMTFLIFGKEEIFLSKIKRIMNLSSKQAKERERERERYRERKRDKRQRGKAHFADNTFLRFYLCMNGKQDFWFLPFQTF